MKKLNLYAGITLACLMSGNAIAQTVTTNGSGQATSIQGLQINGSEYNVTSFDGTNPNGGTVFGFWATDAEAAAAASAVNAALNNAGVSEVETNAVKTSGVVYCVDSPTDFVTNESTTGSFQTVPNSQIFGFFCFETPWYTAWELAPPSGPVVLTNGAGRATGIDNLEVNGGIYNVKSFNALQPNGGAQNFWSTAEEASDAADAINAALNAVGSPDVETGLNEKFIYCIDYPGSGDSFVASDNFVTSPWTQTTDAFLLDGCNLGGTPLFTTWELVSAPPPPLTVEMNVESTLPSDTNLHPHHDGSPSAIAGLNDLIRVTVLGSSTLVGDPVDFNTDDIDTATIKFGAGEGGVAPGTWPSVGSDVNGDGLNDVRFEVLMGDSDIQCSDTDVELTGSTSSGLEFTAVESISADCDAQCHN